MKKLHMVAFILLVIGGLNWLAFGIWGTDIVGWLLGGMSSTVSKLVYILVGLSAIVEIINHKSICKCCEKGASSAGGSM